MQTSRKPPIFNQLDLIVPNVPEATRFFQNVVGLNPVVNEDRFAQLDSGAVTIMLSPDALVPMTNAQGIILHFEVPDVNIAMEQALEHGAKLLWGPQTTDWETKSALFEGPGGVRIDLYTPVKQ